MDDDGLCIPREREALLSFKRDLTDPSSILSSWRVDVDVEKDPRGADCCLWHGVVCHNSTGHVLHLRLCPTDPQFYLDNTTVLGGKLNPSLLDLEYLTELDLSLNRFDGIPVPAFLGSLKNLRYLNLSYGGFSGMIPHQLGNLSGLQYLDLSGGDFSGTIPHQLGNLFGLQYLDLSSGGLSGTIPRQLGNLSGLQYLHLGNSSFKLKSESLEWVSGLSSLRHLDLGLTNLSAANDWLQATNMLPSLQHLLLSQSSLNPDTPPPPALNFSSLSVLDLSFTFFPSIPEWIFRLPALTSLTLHDCGLEGSIPVGLRNLTRLTYLELSRNYFNSSIPLDCFADSSNLQVLHLSYLFGYRDMFDTFTSSFPGSIANLTSLRGLDLSNNVLDGPIPEFIGNLSYLHDLDLSSNKLDGPIPDSIGKLSSLKHLDLGVNLLDGPIPESIGNLLSLNYLDLRGNKLNGLIPHSIGNLSSLQDFDLSNNKLTGPIPDSIGNLSSLKHLDLGVNLLYGPIPDSIGNLSSLKHLDLGSNKLYGLIPDSIEKLLSLQDFDLSENKLYGSIPDSIGNLSSLEEFRVGSNQLNGPLPASFGQLLNLVEISTFGNPLKGVVTELHFAKLTKLTALDAGGNRLSLNVSPNWLPPFQLQYLNLEFWHIGPMFPSWLQSQKALRSLQISYAGISDSIPNWFWDSFPLCSRYNLSHNQIHGNLKNVPSVFPSNQQSAIDLSSNQLTGMLPPFPLGLLGLDISNNLLSGSIFNFLCHKPQVLKSLVYLILRRNHLSQQIPDCWMSWTSLEMINLESNEFVGNIPSSIGQIKGLQSLHLRNNHLHGELRTSIRNLTNLKVINLGENNLAGNISGWIGEKLPLLKILILRSNKFLGHIPKELCALASLQLLDLAHNNLSGTIPRCLNNMTAMATAPNSSSSNKIYFDGSIDSVIMEDAFIVTKNNSLEYTTNLGLMTAMDLSNNCLTGSIPIELTNFAGLRSLNLSNNFLVGQIPQNIGAMGLIESIDISGNQISGQIPPSISHLTSLSWLNLSNNHLIGKMPMGPQLQTFPISCFSGNKLCGPPFSNNCSNSSSLIDFSNKQGKVNGVAVDGVHVSMVVGFIMGLWIVWFPLIFNKCWRLVYFTSIDSLWEKIVSRCQFNLQFFSL